MGMTASISLSISSGFIAPGSTKRFPAERDGVRVSITEFSCKIISISLRLTVDDNAQWVPVDVDPDEVDEVAVFALPVIRFLREPARLLLTKERR